MDMIKKAKYILICLMAVLCLAVVCGCSAGTEEAEEQAPIAEPAAEEAEFSDLTEFTAVTADGEKITQDYFRDYDATIINIWATYCPPCIEEMPKLAELEKNRPDNIGMLLICTDAFSDPDQMQALLDESGYEGINLIRGNGDFPALCKSVQVIPTTVFADREGRLVGEPVIGQSMNPKMTYYKHINAYLKETGLETVD